VRRPPRFAGYALAVALAAWVAPGCSLGEGSGSVTGTLDVPDCWSGGFDLKPTFFAAVPSASGAVASGPSTSTTGSDALQLRIQNGGDFESFSDGLAILVDDAGEVRGDPTADGTPRPSLLNTNLVVALAPGVAPAGVLITPMAKPSIVHATLYLEKTCRTQNIALYAMDAVTLNPDGSCARPDGGDPPLVCDAPAEVSSPDGGTSTSAADASAGAADASAGAAPPHVGASFINFSALFDGNADEPNAQQRLTTATFHFYLADPREICPGGLGPPPRCRGDLRGSFSFYFERGQPAQPFN
jgi:hypothetical protein